MLNSCCPTTSIPTTFSSESKSSITRPFSEPKGFCHDNLRVAQTDVSGGGFRVDLDHWERIAADYEGMNLSAGPHPMRLLRVQVPEAWRAGDLPNVKNGTRVRIAGQVICRQRPGTAKGFVFISLEDETGIANAIVTPSLFEKCRLLITSEDFLIIEGPLQNIDNVIHIKSEIIECLAAAQLNTAASHDFR